MQPGNKTFDSLVLSVMLHGAESWPVSTQMNQLINSFATSAMCMLCVGWGIFDRNIGSQLSSGY